MPQYEYVSIPVNHRREGFIMKYSLEEVVDRQAEKGWRLVQVVDLTAFEEPKLECIFIKGEM